MQIRPAAPRDAAAICAIYNHYVTETSITFEQEPLSVADMQARIEQVQAGYPWLVAERGGRVLGYAYATRWRSRAAYDFTVESTVYVEHSACGGGIGRPLYLALLAALREGGFHVVVGCIALPNPGSIALHEKCGFEKAGHFRQVGRKFDQWIDVGFWQIVL